MFHIEENKKSMERIGRSLRSLEVKIRNGLREVRELNGWFEFDRKQDGPDIVIFTLIYKQPQTKSQIYGLIKSGVTKTQPSSDLFRQQSRQIGEICLEYEEENVTNLILHTFIFLDKQEASIYLSKLLPVLIEIAKEMAVPDQLEPSDLTKLKMPQVSALGKRISDKFNEDELRDLARKLSIDYEDLSGDNKLRKAHELVENIDRHGRVSELLEILREERPRETWSIETGD